MGARLDGEPLAAGEGGRLGEQAGEDQLQPLPPLGIVVGDILVNPLGGFGQRVIDARAEVLFGLEILPQLAAEGGVVVEADHDLAVVLAALPQEAAVFEQALLGVGQRREDLHGEVLVELGPTGKPSQSRLNLKSRLFLE